MKTLNSFLELIHDPRRAQGQRFCLSSFFEMVFLAGMSGRFSINAIARFIEYNQEFFIDRYGLLHGVPKKTVIFNILRDFDYTELNKALVSWMSQYMGNNQANWMSIDGKALASTVREPNGKNQNFQAIVSLFNSAMGVVITTKPYELKKDNEIACALDIIEQLEVKGVIFTLDPLHCQKKLRKPSWVMEMTM